MRFVAACRRHPCSVWRYMRFQRRTNVRTSSVDAFLDFLADLEFDEWIALGTRYPIQPRTIVLLEAIILDRRLEVDAWMIRDAVETIAFLVSGAFPPRPTRTYRAMVHARVAAECAALAILARRWLPPSDVAELLSPFSARLSTEVPAAQPRSARPSPAPIARRR